MFLWGALICGVNYVRGCNALWELIKLYQMCFIVYVYVYQKIQALEEEVTQLKSAKAPAVFTGDPVMVRFSLYIIFIWEECDWSGKIEWGGVWGQ